MHIAATLVLGRDADDVPGVRALAATALELCGAPPEVCSDLCVALSEALTNAVEHAGGNQIVVELDITPHRCELTVRDTGLGFQPPSAPEMPDPHATEGRGLALMKLLAEDVQVRSSPGRGTVVRIRQSLRERVPSGR